MSAASNGWPVAVVVLVFATFAPAVVDVLAHEGATERAVSRCLTDCVSKTVNTPSVAVDETQQYEKRQGVDELIAGDRPVLS
jgi:hypothetical protein